MRYQIKCAVGIIVFLFLSISDFLSQSQDYSVEQLISDIQQQQYEEPIRNCKQALQEMEKEINEQFDETVYIGIANILAEAYIANGNYGLADSLLSHAIGFLSDSNNKSEIYVLYLTKGALFYNLADYYRAEASISEALRLIDIQSIGPEYYSVILSMLSTCYRSLNMLDESKSKIDEAVSYIDESSFNNANIVSIYQKASAIYYDLGIVDTAMHFAKKAYALSKDDENNIAGFFSCANGLAVMYSNQGDYLEALSILHQIEKKQLVDSQKATLYQNIYQDYYYLNKERETAQYAKLCSEVIIQNILNYFFQLPLRDTERLWNNDALQLMVNMGVLDKFSGNDELVGMCYNNNLFVKTLSYEHSSLIKQLANNKQSEEILEEIQDLKERIFAGADTLFYELDLYEKVLLDQLKGSSLMNNYWTITWEDVQRSLKKGECAIEMILYVGFPATINEEKKLLYGALVLTSNIKSPVFIELCEFEDLLGLLAGAYQERELGINSLYQNEVSDSLYNMIWRPIEEYTKDVETIYVSPCLNMQHINLGYIKRLDGSYMNEKYNIQIVSSTKSVLNRNDTFNIEYAAIYGGIDYGKNEENHASLLRSSILEAEYERGGAGFLHGAIDEIDSISTLLVKQDVAFDSYRGAAATEESFKKIDKKSPSIIHIATHGFYYTDRTAPFYFRNLIPYSIADNSMLYSGLLFAGANNRNKTSKPQNDGVLTSEEISWMNLSNTELVTLSACLTGWGMSKQEGFGGLIRAFKSAGVRYIMASLWDVPDKPTAKLMTLFYKNLFAGYEIHDALVSAQRELAKEYPDPYYWAAFILIE